MATQASGVSAWARKFPRLSDFLDCVAFVVALAGGFVERFRPELVLNGQTIGDQFFYKRALFFGEILFS